MLGFGLGLGDWEKVVCFGTGPVLVLDFWGGILSQKRSKSLDSANVMYFSAAQVPLSSSCRWCGAMHVLRVGSLLEDEEI